MMHNKLRKSLLLFFKLQLVFFFFLCLIAMPPWIKNELDKDSLKKITQAQSSTINVQACDSNRSKQVINKKGSKII